MFRLNESLTSQERGKESSDDWWCAYTGPDCYAQVHTLLIQTALSLVNLDSKEHTTSQSTFLPRTRHHQ